MRASRVVEVVCGEPPVERCSPPLGMATGAAGFNVDFHAIRHHGSDVPLEKHYVPKRSQRTRSVLTLFAQDHASTEMVYANADVTKTAAAREVIAFADYWAGAAGTDPGLLVFDSQLTTYAVLDEAVRPGHPLAHSAPARSGRAGRAHRAARQRLDLGPDPALRALPPPPAT